MIMNSVLSLYLYAIAVGFTSAGIMMSFWRMVTGERPRLLGDATDFTPITAMAAIISAPASMFRAAVIRSFSNPLFALALAIISLGWSFLQGVFILTQFLGLQ